MNHLHHHLVDRKLMRFAAIGTADTILGMGIMFGMYNWLGCGYWVSTAANYLITSVISFFANKYLTFHNHQKSIRQAFRFAANIALCYVFAFSVAKPLVIRLQLPGTAVGCVPRGEGYLTERFEKGEKSEEKSCFR